jgi:hypothetical protein
MNLKDFFQSKNFRNVLYTIGVLVFVLAVFKAGMFVGYKRASFFDGAERGYRAVFDERRGDQLFGMMQNDFSNTHGTIGKIVKINLPTIVIADQDNVEKVVLIKDDTLIRQFRDEIKAAGLKVDDFVVVMGTPNDKSQIEAKFVRVMPEPPMGQGALLPPGLPPQPNPEQPPQPLNPQPQPLPKN